MTQYWGPPNYPPPQQQPPYQPPQYPLQPIEPEYYVEETGDSWLRWVIFFVAGSCSTMALVGCCLVLFIVAWVVDTRLGITTTGTPTPEIVQVQNTPATDISQTPPISGDVSLTPLPIPTFTPTPPLAQSEVSDFGDPILAADVGTELIVWNIERNALPNNLAPAEGMEFVAVSVELRPAEATNFAKTYTVTNFLLQNANGVVYQADMVADNGRPLYGGELSDHPVEGDVLFHIPLGDTPLFLVWQATGSNQSHLVKLE